MPASLLYTICFCMRGDLVLMLFRHKPPNAHLWNGLGGKFQPGETPLACVQREIMEEATIDLHLAERLRFTGIVTWGTGHDPGNASTGMYVFVAHFPPTFPIWEQERITPEGLLCWQPLAEVCDPQNTSVVSNIPYFLPGMLTQQEPHEYYCNYREKRLHGVQVALHPCR
jgi:8-oxo-dGTP diphosphatase